jgi:hypothetical protein
MEHSPSSETNDYYNYNRPASQKIPRLLRILEKEGSCVFNAITEVDL